MIDSTWSAGRALVLSSGGSEMVARAVARIRFAP